MSSETFRINEIFHSLQGEGRHAGMSAVFVRFSGCNLRCPFCDTSHEASDEYTADEVIQKINSFAGVNTVIFTGGEPSLQLTGSLVDRLHGLGYAVHIETNGTNPVPESIDWITCSPKGAPLRIGRIDEVKVVYDATPRADSFVEECSAIPAKAYSLQPCDIGDAEANRRITAATVAYVMSHPQWRLSLQTHKYLNIR